MMLPYVVLLASRKGVLRWIAVVLIPVFLGAILKTDSRGGVVALGVLAIAFLGVANRRQRKAALILFPLIGVTLFFLPHSNMLARFSELTAGSDYNFDARDGRWPIWKRGIGLMLTHPILGVGVGAYEAANAVTAGSWKNAHNAYIQIGVELGIGGILAFLIAIRAAIRSGWKVRTASAPTPENKSDPGVAFDRMLATAALCSLFAELTAAVFLSMAYDAMTLFALAVPTGLALSLSAPGLKPRPSNISGGGARPSAERRPGWRTGRRPSMQPVPVAHAPRERQNRAR
jgi:O-antigen ligase